jgi:hypothetical protein
MPISSKRAAPWCAQEALELAQEDKCFRMRFTGEVFLDYDSYADAWLNYIARDWSCGVSGKKNLTFEEAAISEKALKAQADLFPASHTELLCRMVHMSTLKLDELCDCIMRQMELRVIVGENVEVPPCSASIGSGKSEAAVVTRLFIAREGFEGGDAGEMVEVGGADDMLAGDELCITHAEVEYGNGTVALLPVSAIKRPAHDGSRRSCSKAMLRAKVRDVSSRDGYQGAPHVLHAEFCSKFSLSQSIPPHIMRLKEAWVRKQRGEKLAQEKQRAEAALPEPDRARREEKPREVRDVACDDPAVVAAVRRIKIQFQPLFTPENLDLILPTNIRRALHPQSLLLLLPFPLDVVVMVMVDLCLWWRELQSCAGGGGSGSGRDVIIIVILI